MKVHIERNTLQLELIQYRKNVDFIHVYFCKAMDSMQYRPPDAYQNVSNTNQFPHCHFWTVMQDSSYLIVTPFLTV